MTVETQQTRDIKERLRQKFVKALKRWQHQTTPKRPKVELARQLGCDPSLISCWVNGVSFPSWSKIEKVSDLLGVPLSWWLEDTMVLPEPEVGAVFNDEQKSSIARQTLEAKGKLDLTWAGLGDLVGYSTSALTQFCDGRARRDTVAEALYFWLKNDVPRLLEDSKFVDPNQGELL